MFKAGQANPYDEIVTKTTDENLTSENWELILNLCDKVQDEGQEGAHNVIAAVLKRLAHRNPNVQLYALSLTEALSKNLGIELHRELASRAFTQGLEKIITDRTTHEKVKRRALGLIAMWKAEFERDPSLGVMEDCYNSLKAKNYKFETPQEAPPPAVDDEVRRREEEELQRVLEMSMQDKGGRGTWVNYGAGSSSSGAGGSGSSQKPPASSSKVSSAPISSTSTSAFAPPSYQGGYVPARTPPPRTPTPQSAPSPTNVTTNVTTTVVEESPAHTIQQPAALSVSPEITAPTTAATSAPTAAVVTRVRALHTFEPTDVGELAFEKGDIIKVVDRGYKDWWRGQLKGRTGIFPVNYVEPMPEQTAAELAREAEREAAVFAQAANVDKLLTMLRSLDPAKDNLADNEEIQELYRSSMALRPKIVKLIDKYSQKRADLVSMNETFVRARTIFDRMMEESLARHSVYEAQAGYRANQYPDARGRPEYGTTPASTNYGWNPTTYDQSPYFPAPTTSFPEAGFPTTPSQYMDPAAYAAMQQKQSAYAAQNYLSTTAPYGPQAATSYPAQGQQPLSPQPATQQQSPQPQHLQQSPQPAQQQPAVLQTQQQGQGQSSQAQVQSQQQPAAQMQTAGPPYVYDPKGTYADPNVQAWANYYAQGGPDPTGAVYFFSVPGVTDVAPQAAVSGSSPETSLQQVQQQQPQSVQPQQQQTLPQTQQAQQQQLVQQQQPQQDYRQPLQQQQQRSQSPMQGPTGTGLRLQTELGGFQVGAEQPQSNTQLPLNTLNTQVISSMNSYTAAMPNSSYTSSDTNPWAQPPASPPPGSPNQAQAQPTTQVYPLQANPNDILNSTYTNHPNPLIPSPYAQSPTQGPTYMSSGTYTDPAVQPASSQPMSSLQRAMSLRESTNPIANPTSTYQYYSLPDQFSAMTMSGEDENNPSHPGQQQQQQQPQSMLQGVGAPA